MLTQRLNLTGPIFTKELRTTSRRRRYYSLRVAYILLLLLILSVVWYETMRWGHSAINATARMSEAAKSVTTTVIWFIFVVAQMVSVVSLSTSISDEISHRTLGVLMTTPITSLQIVLGKLLSRLLQLGLLIGITLPILAMIRVFGGVPWSFVGCSLMVILCSCIWVGSLSLFYSIYANRAYVAILATVLTLGLINGIIPAIIGIHFHRQIPSDVFESALAWTNPYFLLALLTDAMWSPRNNWFSDIPLMWLYHCLVLLGASSLLIFWGALRVRVIGLRLVVGETDPNGRRRRRREDNGTPKIRRVSNRPVLWKELRQPLFKRRRKRKIVMLGLVLLIMGLFYAGLARENNLDDRDTHWGFGIMLMAIGFLYTAVIPATVIAGEKETRTWPVLMGTALSPGAILMGKWWGSLRTSLPAWILLFGHVGVFTAVQMIHPVAIPLLILALLGPVAFLQGSGLFFSNHCRRTTTAVIANLLLAGLTWALIPMFTGILIGIFRLGRSFTEFFELVICFHPITQVFVILDNCARGWGSLRQFQWPLERTGLAGTIVFLCLSTLIYIGLGSIFLIAARQQLRKRIE